MNKIINIKTKKSINEIQVFSEKIFVPVDIKFENVHLRKLNKLIGNEVFSKNDLYINSKTLWELMQPIGDVGSHNYHELMPEDIFYALNALIEPIAVFKVKSDRYAIVPVYIYSFAEPLMVVIEKDAELMNRQNAKINKIVTIYPKSDLDNYLKGMDEKDILYKK